MLDASAAERFCNRVLISGIVIFRAASEGAAREFMNGDPAVQKGVMKATMFPFKVARGRHDGVLAADARPGRGWRWVPSLAGLGAVLVA